MAQEGWKNVPNAAFLALQWWKKEVRQVRRGMRRIGDIPIQSSLPSLAAIAILRDGCSMSTLAFNFPSPAKKARMGKWSEGEEKRRQWGVL